MDIPGFVALPLLEHRMENGFVDVVAGGENPCADEEEEQHDGDGDGIPRAQFANSRPAIAKDFRKPDQPDTSQAKLTCCFLLSEVTLWNFNPFRWTDINSDREEKRIRKNPQPPRNKKQKGATALAVTPWLFWWAM